MKIRCDACGIPHSERSGCAMKWCEKCKEMFRIDLGCPWHGVGVDRLRKIIETEAMYICAKYPGVRAVSTLFRTSYTGNAKIGIRFYKYVNKVWLSRGELFDVAEVKVPQQTRSILYRTVTMRIQQTLLNFVSQLIA